MAEKVSQYREPYLVAITGTKGKTTITRLLSHVYTQTGEYTLRVDTDGHYVNDQQRSTADDSRQLYGLLPGTAPGRYLYELKEHSGAVALLEVSFSSGGTAGLAYLSHDIGVFTNVYADHIGRRIANRAELARQKADLIFGRMKPNGTVVFNADDELVCANLSQVPVEFTVKHIPVGLNFSHFDLAAHLAKGGWAITREGDRVGIRTAESFQPQLNLKDVYWTYDGVYEPSVYSLMLSLGVIIARAGTPNVSDAIIGAITSYQLDETGGRLTTFEHKGRTIMLDYAHEKESLKHIARLAKHLAQNKTIGILRLNPDRVDDLIKETGRYIANDFDTIIIYDKIDGVRRKDMIIPRWNLVRRPGDTAEIFYQSVKESQTGEHQVFKEIQESKAIDKAFSMARSGDCIVHIVNDDHEQSVAYIKEHLRA